MKRLLDDKDWFHNFGTESYPVSFLHEYSVALIWDILHTAKGPVSLPTIAGQPSSNLLEGVDQIIIPDALQSIAGYIPDISLLKNSRPLRCIEVVVNNPTHEDKLKAMTNLGVEVVQIPARTEQEFLNISPMPGTAIPWWPRFNEDEQAFRQARTNAGVNWQGTRHHKILRGQELADRAIRDLINNLTLCTPETRRAFLTMLAGIPSLDSLYPIRRENPKYDILHPTPSYPNPTDTEAI